MTYYEIQPYTVTVGTTTYTAKYIVMAINYTVGMTEMPVPYNLVTEEGTALWGAQAMIDQMELDNWGTDNMFIVNLVCNQAGVTLV